MEHAQHNQNESWTKHLQANLEYQVVCRVVDRQLSLRQLDFPPKIVACNFDVSMHPTVGLSNGRSTLRVAVTVGNDIHDSEHASNCM